MRPTLQVRLSQHLALTPQLQQSIRLLQLSTLELHQEVEQMLATNPLLETDEEFDAPLPTATQERLTEREEREERVAQTESDAPAGDAPAGEEMRAEEFGTTERDDWENGTERDDFDGIRELPSSASEIGRASCRERV